MDIIFLTLSQIIKIHQDQIERYGGMPGIRDMKLLQSAVTMPAAGFGNSYFHDDLFEMASAYLFHIVKNHPFIDGNKRTGAVAAVVFLIMNGIEVDADEQSFEDLVLSVAYGKLTKAAIADFFRKNALKE